MKKKPVELYEVWEITMTDKLSNKVVDAHSVTVAGYSEIEAIIVDMKERLQKVGVEPESIEFSVAFQRHA